VVTGAMGRTRALRPNAEKKQGTQWSAISRCVNCSTTAAGNTRFLPGVCPGPSIQTNMEQALAIMDAAPALMAPVNHPASARLKAPVLPMPTKISSGHMMEAVNRGDLSADPGSGGAPRPWATPPATCMDPRIQGRLFLLRDDGTAR